MRRPLNWVVVCISLLLLVANRSGSERKAQARISETDHLAAVEAQLLTLSAGSVAVEFGYVRTDGSFVPLPPPGTNVAWIDSDAARAGLPRMLTSTSTLLQ